MSDPNTFFYVMLVISVSAMASIVVLCKLDTTRKG